MYQQTKNEVHFYTLCQFQRLRRQAGLQQPKMYKSCTYIFCTKERESLRLLIAQTVPHWYKYDNGEPAHHSSYVLLMLHILCRNPRTNIGLVLAVKNSASSLYNLIWAIWIVFCLFWLALADFKFMIDIAAYLTNLDTLKAVSASPIIYLFLFC